MIKLERSAGIEPAASAWKAEVLPLYELRIVLAEEGGFEPPVREKPVRQVSNLLP